MNASGRGPQISAEEAAELERARERMFARHKLIEGMIRNNEMQLKNESARGGAEIELECVRRDVAREDAGAGAQAELHIYDGVGHGFGIRSGNTGPIAAWPTRFLEWLDQQGLAKRRGHPLPRDMSTPPRRP